MKKIYVFPILLVVIFLFVTKSNEYKIVKDISRNKVLISEGIWVSETDSLATIKIEKNNWFFQYKGEKEEKDDRYTYKIIENDSVRDFILFNETDTLEYYLDYLTDKNLTIIYKPRGNFHNYRKVK